MIGRMRVFAVRTASEMLHVSERALRTACVRLRIGAINRHGRRVLTEDELKRLAEHFGVENRIAPRYQKIVPQPLDELDEIIARIDPARPCSAPPGSLEKMAFLRARYLRGLPLYHPRDNTLRRSRYD